jgi:hypothetical protein
MKHAHRHSRLSSTNAPSPSCSPQQSKVSKNLLDRSSPFWLLRLPGHRILPCHGHT